MYRKMIGYKRIIVTGPLFYVIMTQLREISHSRSHYDRGTWPGT